MISPLCSLKHTVFAFGANADTNSLLEWSTNDSRSILPLCHTRDGLFSLPYLVSPLAFKFPPALPFGLNHYRPLKASQFYLSYNSTNLICHHSLVFCLSQNTTIGQVIALDNAHKYMNDSVESQTLTGALLGTIHRQRHCGTRVIISTQEPTISHKFLDLCSMTIVHRFTSPDWLPVLEGHLAGISTPLRTARGQGLDGEEAEYEYEGLKGIEITGDATQELFSQIAELRTGEALVFAPTAVIGLKRQTNGPEGDAASVTPRQLASGVLRIVVREQITEGGGKSTMAS